MATLDLQAAFAEIVAEKSTKFGHDRSKTIGSSEMGACALRIGRRKSGQKPDQSYVDTGGYAMRGNVMEDAVAVPVVRKAIETLGGELLYAGQKDQLSLINEKAQVSATPDGLAINMPRDALADLGVPDLLNLDGKKSNARGSFLTEFKSIDPRVNTDKLPKPIHLDQVNLALGLMRSYKEIEWQPHYGLINYIDASEYSKMLPFVVKFDDDGFMGQLARAKQIMNAVKAGPKQVEALRPEGKVAGGKECKTCEFAERCLGYAPMVPRVIQKASPKVVAKINKHAGRLKEATEAIEVWTTAKNETTAKLKELMAKAGTKFIETDMIKLSWSASDGRSSWNTVAMVKKLEQLGVKNVEKKFRKQGKPTESLRPEFVKALA